MKQVGVEEITQAREEFVQIAKRIITPREIITTTFGNELYAKTTNYLDSMPRVRDIYEATVQASAKARLADEREKLRLMHIDYTHSAPHALNVMLYTGAIIARLQEISRYNESQPWHDIMELGFVAAILHDWARVHHHNYKSQMFEHGEISAKDAGPVLTKFDFSESDMATIQEAIRFHSDLGYQKQRVSSVVLAAVMDGDGIDRHANFVQSGIFREILYREEVGDDLDIREIRYVLENHEARFRDSRTWQTQPGKAMYLTADSEIRENFKVAREPVSSGAYAILKQAFPKGQIVAPYSAMFLVEFENSFSRIRWPRPIVI